MSVNSDAIFYYIAHNFSSYVALLGHGQQLKPLGEIVGDLAAKGIAATELDVAHALQRVVHSGILEKDMAAPKYVFDCSKKNFFCSGTCCHLHAHARPATPLSALILMNHSWMVLMLVGVKSFAF